MGAKHPHLLGLLLPLSSEIMAVGCFKPFRHWGEKCVPYFEGRAGATELLEILSMRFYERILIINSTIFFIVLFRQNPINKNALIRL